LKVDSKAASMVENSVEWMAASLVGTKAAHSAVKMAGSMVAC
jgi:hypothetical protein